MATVEAELEAVQRRLARKQHFEEAVASLAAILRDHYAGASPALRKSIYTAVCRVATVLQTRYTAPGFWLAGLSLFKDAEMRVTDSSEKLHLKKCIERAIEHLHEKENEPAVSQTPDNRFLFEGHLTVGREPPPPAWLVAQNFLTTLAVAQDLNSSPGISRNPNSASATPESSSTNEIEATIQEFITNLQDTADLDSVIEQSMQDIGAGPQKPPPASKEVVANLPVITVTEDVIARLGSETECAVCRENLAVGDKMQELPCKHLFHPPCLKPWLEENNSCPICRHELRTDDHAYESWKEREKEAEEERKGAANAVRGGELMYI